jgi:hypothetical protein
MTPTPDTLASATDHRPYWERDDMSDEKIRTQVIDGIECTDRPGLATLTHLSLKSINLKAAADPAFPAPIRGERIGRTYWYPLTAARAYANHYAALVESGKPMPVADGDPDDLLDPENAADALGIGINTFLGYVEKSIPYWDGILQGRPILPKPDVVTIADGGNLGTVGEHREWYRHTLAEHQPTRPGRHANAASGRTGRPRKNAD